MSKDIGDIIAYWNVEHTKEQRAVHMEMLKKYLSMTGLDRMLDAKDVTSNDGPGDRGYASTAIDLEIKPDLQKKVVRALDGSRIRNLTTIHLKFSKNAGVYDADVHHDKVLPMTTASSENGFLFSDSEAEKITAWEGWEGFSHECYITTNGEACAYKCRTWQRYSGNPGDSFSFAADWDELHSKVFDIVYNMAHSIGLV